MTPAAHALALTLEPALVVVAAAAVRRFEPGGRLLAASFVVLAFAGAAHLLWFVRGGVVSLPVVAIWLVAMPPLLAIELQAGAAWSRRALERARDELEERVEERTQELARVNASLRAEISEHRATESERQRLARRVQESQRLESLGLLAAGVAHDFNNLLTVILGHARLALAEIPAGRPRAGAGAHLRAAGHGAAELTARCSSTRAEPASSRKPVELYAPRRRDARLLRASIPKAAPSSSGLAPGVFVEADVTQLRQIVLNLVQNASEARAVPRAHLDPYRLSSASTRGPRRAYGADDARPGPTCARRLGRRRGYRRRDAERRIFDPFFTTKL